MVQALVFGGPFAIGLVLIALSGILSRSRSRRRGNEAPSPALVVAATKPESGAASPKRRLSSLAIVQLVGAVGGGFAGWAATGLMGMLLLLGGLGALLPAFMVAPARRRRQTREALAWSLWSRQLAELARAGSGLSDSLMASIEHAPAQIAPTVASAAATAELDGLEAALEKLASAGTVWEPEVAAGLRMAWN